MYGPIMVLGCWAKGYQEPLYLVSNLATAEEGADCSWGRAGIATKIRYAWGAL